MSRGARSGLRSHGRFPIAFALAGLAGLAALAGCAQQPPRDDLSGVRITGSTSGRPAPAPAMIDPTRSQTYDDVVRIVQFWGQTEPSLRDADRRTIGFRTTVYFVSATTEKGEFVPGRILCWLYEVGGPEAAAPRRLLHTWELTESESMGFRVRKRAIGGHYYGFLLTWPDTLRLDGKRIELQFGYERGDGRVVKADARRFRVPLPADQVTPTTIQDSRYSPGRTLPGESPAPGARPADAGPSERGPR